MRLEGIKKEDVMAITIFKEKGRKLHIAALVKDEEEKAS